MVNLKCFHCFNELFGAWLILFVFPGAHTSNQGKEFAHKEVCLGSVRPGGESRSCRASAETMMGPDQLAQENPDESWDSIVKGVSLHSLHQRVKLTKLCDFFFNTKGWGEARITRPSRPAWCLAPKHPRNGISSFYAPPFKVHSLQCTKVHFAPCTMYSSAFTAIQRGSS